MVWLSECTYKNGLYKLKSRFWGSERYEKIIKNLTGRVKKKDFSTKNRLHHNNKKRVVRSSCAFRTYCRHNYSAWQRRHFDWIANCTI